MTTQSEQNKKYWVIKHITNPIDRFSKWIKDKTTQNLQDWIIAILFIIGLSFSYIFYIKHLMELKDILQIFVLWITFCAIMWYTKETYWLKQVQQKTLDFERNKIKIKLIEDLIGNRNDTKGDKFNEALNKIPVVFCESEEIIQSYKDYIKYSTKQNKDEKEISKKLLNLIRLIYKDIGLKQKYVTDDLLLNAFNIKK